MKSHVLTAVVFAALIAAFVLVATDGRLPWRKPPVAPVVLCEPHGVDRTRCEICKARESRGGTLALKVGEPKEGVCPNTQVVIEMKDEVAKSVGLETAEVTARPIAETIRANGETMWPPGRLARVAPRVAGIVKDVKAGLGEEVEEGAVLAIVQCPELATAKSAYLQAKSMLELRTKTWEKKSSLAERKLITGQEALEAETEKEEARLALEAAAQALRGLGLTAEQVSQVGNSGDLSALMDVRAPFAGAVVETSAVTGEAAAPDRPLFAVAALDRMWVSIDVYESDLQRVEREQRVVFHVDGLGGRRFTGKVAAIGGEMDDRTRTVRVFADVKNADGLLRAKMFGRAEISVKQAEPTLLVPREAVQYDGDCNLVFVAAGKERYQARQVQLGTAYEGGFEVKGGLTAGEKVVTEGAFLLKTEVLKGQMGAG